MTTQTSPALDIGKQLVDLCKQGKNLEAIGQLYSDNIVSIEVCGTDEMPARMEGIEAIKGKNQWWMENHEVHSGEAIGPFPHGDRFIVLFDYEVTPKCGPMAGNRIKMQEAGLYTVADGKVSQEEFFYDISGMDGMG